MRTGPSAAGDAGADSPARSTATDGPGASVVASAGPGPTIDSGAAPGASADASAIAAAAPGATVDSAASAGVPARPADARGGAASLIRTLVGAGGPGRDMSAFLLLGCAVLLLGLEQVRTSTALGFTWNGAFDGIASQLGVTGPAAVIVALATVLNISGGAIALRLVAGSPFRSPADMVLGGLVGAVLLDTGALFLLGGIGFFGFPELAGIHALLFAAYFAGPARPLLAGSVLPRPARPASWWLLVAAIWVGPVLLQLAAPVVPFIDVLPNHVAPVEHLRVFGDFATLTTSPSPIYGPSRLLLGYVGLLGTISTMTGLNAALAIAAFALPLTVLMAVAVHQAANRLFGAGAGFWALLAFPLTFTFVRLADVRATVLVFPIAVWALATIAAEPLSAAPSPEAGGGGAVGRATRRVSRAGPGSRGADLVWLAAAFGAAILVHPTVGALLAGTAVVAILLDPDRLARRLVPAVAAGCGLAVAQAATMLSLGLPSWAGLVGLPLAILLGDGLAAGLDRFELPWRALAGGILAAVLVGLLLFARTLVQDGAGPVSDAVSEFPLLTVTALLGLVLSARSRARGWRIVAAGISATLVATVAVALLPNQSLLQQAFHYEVPKALGYWTPVMLALAAGGGLAAIWQRRALGPLRHISILAFLIAALFPLSGPLVAAIEIKEHRGAESLAADLREAESGYWAGYPDSRLIVDAGERQVLDALRSEVAAGRLGPRTSVLHIAASFQQWASVPIGVFTGALETSVSLSPEHSIHTDGGRLFGFDSLAQQLAGPNTYVVLEPNGLPSGLTGQIQAAGYHEIFANARATIYVRD